MSWNVEFAKRKDLEDARNYHVIVYWREEKKFVIVCSHGVDNYGRLLGEVFIDNHNTVTEKINTNDVSKWTSVSSKLLAAGHARLRKDIRRKTE